MQSKTEGVKIVLKMILVSQLRIMHIDRKRTSSLFWSPPNLNMLSPFLSVSESGV